MYNEHDSLTSLTSKHKITPDGLRCQKNLGVVATEKGAFRWPSTMVANFTFLLQYKVN